MRIVVGGIKRQRPLRMCELTCKATILQGTLPCLMSHAC